MLATARTDKGRHEMASAMDRALLVLTVNGQKHKLFVNPQRTLLDVLRNDLELTGTKVACDGGECGSCIVLLGRKGVMSCLLPVSRAQAKDIVTIEGLADHIGRRVKLPNGRTEILNPLQEAFYELGASQCGFCIPGFIMEAAALLKSTSDPSRETIKKRLSRNVCRCTGYVKIVDAVEEAAAIMRGEGRRLRKTPNIWHLVGEPILRVDTLDEVTGRAKYAADIKMPGMLYARVLRSPHHHAKILSMDTSKAEALPGVEAVVAAKDIPGDPATINGKPQPFMFPKDKVRFIGEAVAAVAAVSEAIADEAVQLIKVQYEPLPPVLDPMKSEDADAPVINTPEPNVALAMNVVYGNVEEAFRRADVIVENTYVTPRQEHFYMEPEAALAYLEKGGKLIVKFPTHQAFEALSFLSSMLAIPPEKIRIICPPIGGNFGGREDYIHAGVVALLALKTKKSVKLVYTREESLLGSSKWYGFNIKYKTGASKDGKIVATQAEIRADGGCWRQPSTDRLKNLMVRNTFFATGPYKVPNVLFKAYEVTTNSPRAIPMRGIQSVAFAFAHEAQMDMVAEKLGLDPMVIRLRNALVPGDQAHNGQVLLESVGIKDAFNALQPYYKQYIEDAQANPSISPWKKGVGIGAGWKGIGRAGVTKGAVELLEDGRVHAFSGGVEKGQGLATVFTQIVAEELGLPTEEVLLTTGDTELANYPIITAGQGTTTLAGGAILDAARRLKEAMVQVAAEMLEQPSEKIVLKGGYLYSMADSTGRLSLKDMAAYFKEKSLPTKYEGEFSYQHTKPVDPDTGQGAACDVYGYCAAVAEVEVNTETGQVRVPRIVYAADAGRVLNPMTFEGQCEGGVVFGLGLALKEKYMPGQTMKLKEYNLPTIEDMPDSIKVLSVGKPFSIGPFGAKGGGEMSDIAPVPAILNGLAHALGFRLFELPATPENIRAALERKAKGKVAERV